MARASTKKDTTKEEVLESKTTEIETTNETELELQLKQKKEENRLMQEQIAKMQQMMLELQNAVMQSKMQQATQSTSGLSENVKIRSHFFGQIPLVNSSGETVVVIDDSGEIATVSARVLDTIMTQRNRKFFRQGLLEFVDDSEKYYDSYSIKKPFILSEENIRKVFELDYDKCLARLDELTSRKSDELISSNICWTAVRLLVKEEIDNAMLVQNIIETYFPECGSVKSAMGKCLLAKELRFIQ